MNEALIQWINLHLPSSRPQDLMEILSGNSAAAELLIETGEALAACRMQHMQILEDWFWNAWPGLSSFTRQEQTILRYYFPLCRLIVTDLQRSHCLTTIFRLPCRIRETGPVFQFDHSSYLQEGENYEKAEDTALNRSKRRFLIEIGPVDAAVLPDWTPGGKHRAFLENGVLPMLLPAGSTAEISMLSDTPAAHDFTENTPVYWDQNFQPL